METPSNPTMKMIDIEKVAGIARSRNNILFAVDNTFLSPYFQVSHRLLYLSTCTVYSVYTFPRSIHNGHWNLEQISLCIQLLNTLMVTPTFSWELRLRTMNKFTPAFVSYNPVKLLLFIVRELHKYGIQHLHIH